MTAYCLFQNIEITDSVKMNEYVKNAMPLTRKYGGEYIVLGGEANVKEGDWKPISPVIIKFPSLADAQRWYDSDDYKPLKDLRHSAGRFSAVFIAGVDEELRN